MERETWNELVRNYDRHLLVLLGVAPDIVAKMNHCEVWQEIERRQILRHPAWHIKPETDAKYF